MRRMVIGIILCVGVGWFGAGCGILGLDGEVEVRVRNGSDLNLDEAALFLPGVTLEFLDLEAGETTPYSEVQKAYDYASAQVVVGQDTARIQVIDYVGETPLKGGRYTYILRVFPGNPLTLGLDFEKDS